MDSIDKSLSSLMQQIESIDGKQGSVSPPNAFMNRISSFSGETDMFSLAKKYFIYWSLFLFVVITVLVIKPANMYTYNPSTRQSSFSLSSFLMTVLVMYFGILTLYWVHRLYIV